MPYARASCAPRVARSTEPDRRGGVIRRRDCAAARRQQGRQQEVLQLGAERLARQQPTLVDRPDREIEQRPPIACRRTAQIESGLKSQRVLVLEAQPLRKARLQRLARYL